MNIRKLKLFTLFYWLDVMRKFFISIYNRYFLVKNKRKYAHFDETAEVRVPCSFNPQIQAVSLDIKTNNDFISDSNEFLKLFEYEK